MSFFLLSDGKHCDSRDRFCFCLCNSTNYDAVSTISINKYLLNEKITKGFSVKEKTKRDIAGFSRMNYSCVLF